MGPRIPALGLRPDLISGPGLGGITAGIWPGEGLLEGGGKVEKRWDNERKEK